MKRWKKITLVAFALAVLSQAPFIYRRFQLRRLNYAISVLSTQRANLQTDSRFADYAGVIHVHSFLGGHSTGTFDEIIQAAQQNGLRFVVMTEHPSASLDTAAMTLRGTYGGVLFVGGNEVVASNGDRLLLIPGRGDASAANSMSPGELAIKQHEGAGLSLVAYPDEFKSWGDTRFDGIEVYNLFTNSKRINRLAMFFDGVWSYASYGDLMFARFFERPGAALQKLDETARSGRRVVAIGGNDAHANVGLQLADFTGRRWLSLRLDPYARSFRVVRTHVLLDRDAPLNAYTLLEALLSGHSYISFDIFGDAAGFSLTADNGSELKMMGDEIQLIETVRLSVSAPLKCRFVLFRDGAPVESESDVTNAAFVVRQKGVYRVEAYLDQLPSPPAEKLWIISNPVYVR